MFGLGINKLGVPTQKRAFTTAQLYARGEEGIFNDIQTYSTSYFTDTAGTDPADLEDTIALVLDQSGNSNDWSQAITGARPKLSARYNLLTYSEQFDNAAWTKSGATITVNAVTAPDGTLTADKLVELASTGEHSTGQNILTAGLAFNFSVYVKAAERSIAFLRAKRSTGVYSNLYFDLTTGTVGTVGAEWINASILHVGDGWYRISGAMASAGASPNFSTIGMTTADGGLSYAGDGTSGIYIWGADLRLASDTDQPAYQRVTTATDYDDVGFDPYLQFDRIDDALTATIPAITGGTLVLATRSGIWIDDDINASAGTFSIGPTTYTGGPTGLLSVIGDKLIGPPVLIDRQLTAQEKNGLVRWFRERGAGKLYVLGGELNPDPSLETGTGWTLAPDWSIGSGELSGAATTANAVLGSVLAGTSVLVSFALAATSGSVRFRAGGNDTVATTGLSGQAFAVGAVGISTVSGGNLWFDGVSAFTGEITNISVRELTQPGA
jgi:hypothetical protein